MAEPLPPLLGAAPKVLVLAAAPARAGRRYADARGQFWTLLGAALGMPLDGLPYEERLAAIAGRGVALWEVLASVSEEPEPNAVSALVREHGIKAVFCNGASAWRAFQQYAAESIPGGTEAFELPTSQPTKDGPTLEEKLRNWMKISLYICAALFALTTVQAARLQAAETKAAQPQAAEVSLHELVDRANKALRGDSSHGRLVMSIVTPKWERQLEVEGWNRDRQYAFIVIHNPPKDRGNITLRRKNEMWVWLNKVERVIKVPPTMMHSAWQGSDFTYEDIVKADSVVKDYRHTLLSKKTEGDHTVYEVECDPKPDAPVVWGKILLWIGLYGEDVVPVKEEDYSERGELIRTITLSEVKKMGGRLIPAKLECRPARKPGQKTMIEYKSLEFDVPLADDFFSVSRLQGGEK